MSNNKVTVKIEQTHDCGHAIETIAHMGADTAFSLSLGLDNVVMNSVPTGKSFPEPVHPKKKLELTGHYGVVEINGVELRDHRFLCQKCGADVLFPGQIEEQAE